VKGSHTKTGANILPKTLTASLVAVAAFLLVCPVAQAGQVTIAVAPFQINSMNNIDYIRDGVHTMLLTRLSWKEHVRPLEKKKPALPPKTDQTDGKSDLPSPSFQESDLWLTGSITEFAGAFSIDTKVYNTQTGQVNRFYSQARSIEEIIPKTSLLAAKINKTMFNRTTAAYKQLETKTAEQMDTTPAILENPEKMMHQRFGKRSQTKKPFWKFWENDETPRQPEEETQEDKPFWKIW